MSSLLRRAPRAIPLSARAFSTAPARSSFAKLTIIGRLADTPELQATSTGQEILRYAVGTSSGPRDNQKTSWFRVTSFLPEGPQRDFIASLDKGTLVYVEGDATMSSYQDAEGKPRNSLNVVQQKLEVLSPKKTQQ
ncbi:single-strand binding protein family [Hyaloscypha variabilis]